MGLPRMSILQNEYANEKKKQANDLLITVKTKAFTINYSIDSKIILSIHTSQYYLDREHRMWYQLECFVCEYRTANRQISFPYGKTLGSSRCM